MIIVYHKNNHIDYVFDHIAQSIIHSQERNVVKTLLLLASSYEQRILVWCHSDQKQFLNIEAVKDALSLKNMMVSYGAISYLPPQIGYVEDSPFLKVNYKVKYPTWCMSEQVGAIYGFQFIKFKKQISSNNLNYVLNSIAKLGMPNGLFCYAVPQLLAESNHKVEESNAITLFKFVKQHYKTRWVFLLALNYLWHEKRIMFWPLLHSLCYKRKKFDISIPIESLKSEVVSPFSTIDVIIPTIGREQYLQDVLKDLSQQTYMPKQVIIVEQNPDLTSKTDLDFIEHTSWPFKIVHHFIHQAGACNARNLALLEVSSDYVYLADDDNRFNSSLLEDALAKMDAFNLDVISMSYLQKNEIETVKQPVQWSTFGAGCSILKSEFLKHVSFNIALEFGYGEDVDFGCQLRNMGADIIYMPNLEVLHLKAPIGGFRSTYKQPWINDIIQPKPAPTVMLNKLNNSTQFQLLGYKTVLMLNYFFVQKIKNPFRYFKKFLNQWERSVYWANELKNSGK